MNRIDILKKREKQWHNIETLIDLREKEKNKDKSISYNAVIEKEKFKYKIYNAMLKQK